MGGRRPGYGKRSLRLFLDGEDGLRDGSPLLSFVPGSSPPLFQIRLFNYLYATVINSAKTFSPAAGFLKSLRTIFIYFYFFLIILIEIQTFSHNAPGKGSGALHYFFMGKSVSWTL